MIRSRIATSSFGLPQEGTVPTPCPECPPTEAPHTELLHRRILATNAALHGARAAFEHCPSAENQAAVDCASRRLDQLLDQLPRTGDDE